MSSTMKSLGIDRLTFQERVALIQEIWDSIASEVSASELTDEQKAELRRRANEHRANPGDVIPWEEIKAQAMERLSK